MNTILIVEDEDRIRQIFKRWFEHNGYKVREASDAQTAREHLWAAPIDLVLLDLRMPDVTGQELYTLIRTFHKKVKVMTASVYPVEQQRQMITDADDYYDKADGHQRLMEKVAHMFGDFSEKSSSADNWKYQ